MMKKPKHQKYVRHDPARMFNLQRGANLERKAVRRKVKSLLEQAANADGRLDAVEVLMQLGIFLDKREKRTRAKRGGL